MKAKPSKAFRRARRRAHGIEAGPALAPPEFLFGKTLPTEPIPTRNRPKAKRRSKKRTAY